MHNSSHTDFFSTGLSTFNNLSGENHKKLSQNGEKPSLKGEIFHKPIYIP